MMTGGKGGESEAEKQERKEKATQMWMMQQMQAGGGDEDSPMAKEARLQKQQQFMKWRMGGKEAPVEDPEFEAVERLEDKMKWQQSGWREWTPANAASMQDQA